MKQEPGVRSQKSECPPPSLLSPKSPKSAESKPYELLPPAVDAGDFLRRLARLHQDAERVEFTTLCDASNAATLCDLLTHRLARIVMHKTKGILS